MNFIATTKVYSNLILSHPNDNQDIKQKINESYRKYTIALVILNISTG